MDGSLGLGRRPKCQKKNQGKVAQQKQACLEPRQRAVLCSARTVVNGQTGREIQRPAYLYRPAASQTDHADHILPPTDLRRLLIAQKLSPTASGQCIDLALPVSIQAILYGHIRRIKPAQDFLRISHAAGQIAADLGVVQIQPLQIGYWGDYTAHWSVYWSDTL